MYVYMYSYEYLNSSLSLSRARPPSLSLSLPFSFVVPFLIFPFSLFLSFSVCFSLLQTHLLSYAGPSIKKNQIHHPSPRSLTSSFAHRFDWPSSFWPCKRASVDAEELARIANFSCRKAGCFKPADRAFVLNAIRESFGSEAEFDTFVRTHLPAVLAKSKREYSGKLLAVAMEVVDLVFGA